MLTSQSHLEAVDVAQFNRDGYVIARGLANRDLCERMRVIARDHVQRELAPVEYETDVGYPGAPRSRAANGGRTARRLLQACSREALFREWATPAALHVRLVQLHPLRARIALVQAHHNCVMTKHPQFGSLTGWHQDIRYWSFERSDLISVWLALGVEREQNGGLRIIPGSHMLNFEHSRFDDAMFFREDDEENLALLDRRVPVEMDRGDVLFFHCRLLHSAGRNRGTQTKYSVVFTYCSMDNRPIPDTRSASLPLLGLD